MAFLDDLRRYGPDSTHETGPDEARAYCARLTREHYENFSVVTWLTPRALRPAM
jgi:phytoene/squalene synthetase